MYNRNYGGFDYVRIHSELLKSVFNSKFFANLPVTDGYTKPLAANKNIKNMYYYCYISENKVNQIIDSYEKGLVTEKVKSTEVGYNVNNELEVGFWDFFKNKLSFGRGEKINNSETKRNTIVSKLTKSIELLKNEFEKFPEYKYLSLKNLKKTRIVHYSGPLKVVKYDNQYAFLESLTDKCLKLKLTCSLKYFSDLYGANSSNPIHSGNIDFFEGRINPEFETTIYILNVSENFCVATPIFIAMSLNNKLQI